MPKNTSIPIKNIYIMLAYAFQALRQGNYEKVSEMEFEDARDLFAAILAKGVSMQLKQGLHREYIPQKDALSVLRGKLDMATTVRNRIQHKPRLDCEFDELTENNLPNQILKTTMLALLRHDGVQHERKTDLKTLLVFFDGISLLPPPQIPWNRLLFHRNNRNYELLMNICRFALDGLLHDPENRESKMAAFTDEHMARLYERFVLEYYRRHHPELNEIKAARIPWHLTGPCNEADASFLPAMQTDVMLRLGEKSLIIDAKYYGRTLQEKFGKQTLHSANVYQIFTYVKNLDKDNTGNVSGVLLYAKTNETATPDCLLTLGNNRIGATTLDLNLEFSEIAKQLDRLVDVFLSPGAA
ncbi:MAG: 5-methylcytosine-specific restriction endonuclease system specificity protein McrC [Kiritimatiellae bacterium]|nr:5-methylcytosine-specific restriction endonuclease system specificity protein McrC [Kiritimatiellia bacterium]